VIGGESEEIKLLREIRDLMVVIADAYRDDYEQRQSARQERRINAIRSLVNSSPKRRKVWDLADGKTSQRDLAKAAGMDEGGASRYFKSLRELGAIDGALPLRVLSIAKEED
jgi:hypothetical protein